MSRSGPSRRRGAHIRVRLYDPGIPAPAPTVILLHGGGWVFGSLDTYDGFARQIAKRSGVRCLTWATRWRRSTRSLRRLMTASRPSGGRCRKDRASGSMRGASPSWQFIGSQSRTRGHACVSRRRQVRSAVRRCSTAPTRPTSIRHPSGPMAAAPIPGHGRDGPILERLPAEGGRSAKSARGPDARQPGASAATLHRGLRVRSVAR